MRRTSSTKKRKSKPSRPETDARTPFEDIAKWWKDKHVKTERTRVWEKLDELWDSQHGDNFFKYILSTFTQYHFHMFRCFHFVEDLERGQNARKNKIQFLNFCDFVARTFRSTSDSISADAARFHFLAQSYLMIQNWISSMASSFESWANVTLQI